MLLYRGWTSVEWTTMSPLHSWEHCTSIVTTQHTHTFHFSPSLSFFLLMLALLPHVGLAGFSLAICASYLFLNFILLFSFSFFSLSSCSYSFHHHPPPSSPNVPSHKSCFCILILSHWRFWFCGVFCDLWHRFFLSSMYFMNTVSTSTISQHQVFM